MRTARGAPAFMVRVCCVLLIAAGLGGCGAAALVSGTATLTGQAIRTTGKAAGLAARTTLNGARAVGRVAKKPFQRAPDEPE